MSSLRPLLIGLGVGAGTMYLMDPRYGKRRRAMIQDQFAEIAHNADEMVDKSMRDMRNRAQGIVAETYSKLSEQDTSDWIVEQRVRSEMGRIIPYSRSIDVMVHDGLVSLRGPILMRDKAYLLGKINHLPGVRTIADKLEALESTEGVPGLHVEGRNMPASQGRSWSPSARFLGGLAGAGILAFGATRGGLIGSSMSLAGIGLVARSISNKALGQLVGLSSEPGAITTHKAINIDVPVHEVYDLWNNFENFPQFMNHLKQVTNLGGGLSHWVATGPANSSVEWDALEVQNIPDRVIAWRSTPDSQVKTEGSVRFRENQRGGTTVYVHMVYSPPAGVIGHAVATIFGDNPKQAIDEDLQRMKTLLEKGKTTTSGKKVTRSQVQKE